MAEFSFMPSFVWSQFQTLRVSMKKKIPVQTQPENISSNDQSGAPGKRKPWPWEHTATRSSLTHFLTISTPPTMHLVPVYVVAQAVRTVPLRMHPNSSPTPHPVTAVPVQTLAAPPTAITATFHHLLRLLHTYWFV